MSLELSNASSRSNIFTLSQDQSDLEAESLSNRKNPNVYYKKFISKLGLLFEVDETDLDSLYSKIVECANKSKKFNSSTDQDISDIIEIAKQLKQNHCLLKNMVHVLDSRFLQSASSANTKTFQTQSNKNISISNAHQSNQKQQTTFSKKQVAHKNGNNQQTFQNQITKASINPKTSIGSLDKVQQNYQNPSYDSFGGPENTHSSFFETPVEKLEQVQNSHNRKGYFGMRIQNKSNEFKKKNRSKNRNSRSAERKKKYEAKIQKIYDQMNAIRLQINSIDSQKQSSINSSIISMSYFQVRQPQQSIHNQSTAFQRHKNINIIYDSENSAKNMPKLSIREIRNKQQQYQSIKQTARQSIKSDGEYIQEEQEKKQFQKQQFRRQNIEGSQLKNRKGQIKGYVKKLQERNTKLQDYIERIEENMQHKPMQEEQTTLISNQAYSQESDLIKSMLKKKTNKNLQTPQAHYHKEQENKNKNVVVVKQETFINHDCSVSEIEDVQNSEFIDQNSDHPMQSKNYHSLNSHKNSHSLFSNEQVRPTKMIHNVQYINQQENHEQLEDSVITSSANNQTIIIPKKSGSRIFHDTRKVQSKVELSEDRNLKAPGQQIQRIKDTVAQMFEKLQSITQQNISNSNSSTQNYAQSYSTKQFRQSGVGDYTVNVRQMPRFEKRIQKRDSAQKKPSLSFSYQSAESIPNYTPNLKPNAYINFNQNTNVQQNKSNFSKMSITFNPANNQPPPQQFSPKFPVKTVQYPEPRYSTTFIPISNHPRNRSRSVERIVYQSPVKNGYFKHNNEVYRTSPVQKLQNINNVNNRQQFIIQPRNITDNRTIYHHPPPRIPIRKPPTPVPLTHIKSTPNFHINQNYNSPHINNYRNRNQDRSQQSKTNKKITVFSPPQAQPPNFIESKIIYGRRPSNFSRQHENRYNHRNSSIYSKSNKSSKSGKSGKSRSRSKGISITDTRKRQLDDSYY